MLFFKYYLIKSLQKIMVQVKLYYPISVVFSLESLDSKNRVPGHLKRLDTYRL